MQIMIEPTDQIAMDSKMAARVWHGISESGARCVLRIIRIDVAPIEDASEFRAALMEAKDGDYPGHFL